MLQKHVIKDIFCHYCVIDFKWLVFLFNEIIQTYSCFDYKKQKVIQVRPYAAWWCCCMPMHFIKDYGLPYPLFFRGDDQEYALRANKKILILNRLCIWHPKFSTKGSLFRTYLDARNYAIVTSLHYKYAKWKILRNTWIKIIQAVIKGNKDKAQARIWALNDFNIDYLNLNVTAFVLAPTYVAIVY